MAIPECFSNLISIRDLTNTTPVFGLYLDDLDGVDGRVFAQLKTNDDNSLSDWWNKFYENGVHGFIADVRGKLDKDFYQEKNLMSAITGEFVNTQNTSGSGEAGVLIDGYLTRYSRLSLVSLRVWSQNAVDSPEASFKIYDDQNGNLLDTVTSELSEGFNKINLYKEYNEPKLYITFNRSEVTSRETRNFSTIRRHGSPHFLSKYEPVIKQINGGGLTVDFNIRCKAEEVICSKLDQLKYPFYYFLGRKLTEAAYVSRNVNASTVMTEERHKELIGHYTMLYDKQIDSAMKLLRIDDDRYCYECKPFVRSKTFLP